MRTALSVLPFLFLAAPIAAQSRAPAPSTPGATIVTGEPGAQPLVGPVRSSARLPDAAPSGWSRPTPPAPVAQGAVASGRAVPAPLLVGAGILGGGLGLVGGAYAGALSGDWHCQNQGGGECDGPVVFGAVLGGIAGEALLLPLAEHLAGGRRGPFLAELGASLGLAGAGMALLYATHYDAPASTVILVGVPLAQLGVVTWLEGRRK